MNLFNDSWYEATTNEIIKSNKENRGYVYLIKVSHSNMVKIGMSVNLTTRLNSHRQNLNSILYLVGYVYTFDYQKLEKEIHKKYYSRRESGEWFDIADEEANEIITSNNGVLVNSYIGKESNFIDGEYFNISCSKDVDVPVNKPFYDKMIRYFDSLPRDERIDKSEIFSHVRKLDATYAMLKQKTITVRLKEYLKSNNIKYSEKRSDSYRSITIYKIQ